MPFNPVLLACADGFVKPVALVVWCLTVSGFPAFLVHSDFEIFRLFAWNTEDMNHVFLYKLFICNPSIDYKHVHIVKNI